MTVALFNFKLPREPIHNRKARFHPTFCNFRSYREMLTIYVLYVWNVCLLRYCFCFLLLYLVSLVACYFTATVYMVNKNEYTR